MSHRALNASTREQSPVVHVLASGGLYGIERMVGDLLPALQRRGRSVAFVCLGARGSVSGLVGERIAESGVPVRFVSVSRGFRPGDIVALARALRDLEASIVHVHGYKACILCGLGAPIHRRPICATVHSEAWLTPEVRWHLRAEALLLRQARAVIAVSSGVQRDLAHRRVPAASVISNGLSPAPAVLTSSPATPLMRLIVVGRLVAGKNVDILLRAFAHVRQEFPSARLAIAGEGPERRPLEALAATLGVRESVEFLGFVNPIGAELDRSGVFVMPSQSEGMPMSLLEAMAHGRAIVATSVGGIPDMVQHQREAILVRAGDPAALATALKSLLGDQRGAERLGGAARERFCREFTAERMAADYAMLYTGILLGVGTTPDQKR